MEKNTNKYDCLILSHVLEHIYDLNKFIETISLNIKEDGYLYIEIPNAEFYSYFNDSCPLQEINLEHINFFSKYALNKLLLNNGFLSVSILDDYFLLNNYKYYVIRAIFKKKSINKSFLKETQEQEQMQREKEQREQIQKEKEQEQKRQQMQKQQEQKEQIQKEKEQEQKRQQMQREQIQKEKEPHSFFWCLYIIHYGIRSFMEIGNKYGNVECDEKLKIVNDMKENPSKLKEMNQRMLFSGFTQNPEQILAASDFLCLPSHREGFGMVIIEAAAVGVPAIGTRIHGITDAIEDRQTGFLVPLGDVGALAEAITLWSESPQVLELYSKAARERVILKFEQQKIVASYVEYFFELFPGKVQ
jgi:glycosyltransferase involved in cell wall biosynthesis